MLAPACEPMDEGKPEAHGVALGEAENSRVFGEVGGVLRRDADPLDDLKPVDCHTSCYVWTTSLILWHRPGPVRGLGGRRAR